MDSLRRKNPLPKPAPTNAPLKRASLLRQVYAPPTSSVPFGGPQKIMRRKKNRFAARQTRAFFHFLLWTGGTALLLGIVFFGYFSWKIGVATRTMSIVPRSGAPVTDTIHGATSLLTPIFHPSRTPLPGEESGRTNILLLGKSNTGTAGQKLTDTIMIASFDFSRKKIALLSLPRDLYVEIPGTHIFTKLNALYQIDMENHTGDETIKAAVSNITGIPIHAFAVLDYDGFTRIVDLMGGVSAYVDRDLLDTRFPGPNYTYETFKIDKGWQDLDGATALKYVRERHSDPEGDFGRAKRQQAILSAIKSKAFSMGTIFDPLAVSNSIDTLGEHIRTDLSTENLQSLIALASEFDTKNITNAVVDAWKKESLLRVSHVQVGPVAMFILLPRTGDWSEVRELAGNIFDLDTLKAREAAVEGEDAHIAIVNESTIPALGARVAGLMSNTLNMKHVELVPAPDSTDEKTRRDTSVIVRRGGTEAVYTVDELAKKFSLPVIEQRSLPDAENINISYDITLLLGNDLAKRLSFKEDTPEDIQNADNNLDYQKQLDSALSAENK